MDFLKPIFGEKALTFAEFTAALEGNKEIKLANLAGGQYIDKDKLETKIKELDTANQTIKSLQDAVKKFDGVDVEKLKNDLADMQTKYSTDIAQLKLDSAVDIALVASKVKNPKIAKAALDLSAIKLDGDKLLGLEDQLTKLKETDGYLFETEQSSATPPEGNASGIRMNSGGAHGAQTTAEYDKMSDEEYYKTVLKK